MISAKLVPLQILHLARPLLLLLFVMKLPVIKVLGLQNPQHLWNRTYNLRSPKVNYFRDNLFIVKRFEREPQLIIKFCVEKIKIATPNLVNDILLNKQKPCIESEAMISDIKAFNIGKDYASAINKNIIVADESYVIVVQPCKNTKQVELFEIEFDSNFDFYVSYHTCGTIHDLDP